MTPRRSPLRFRRFRFSFRRFRFSNVIYREAAPELQVAARRPLPCCVLRRAKRLSARKSLGRNGFGKAAPACGRNPAGRYARRGSGARLLESRRPGKSSGIVAQDAPQSCSSIAAETEICFGKKRFSETEASWETCLDFRPRDGVELHAVAGGRRPQTIFKAAPMYMIISILQLPDDVVAAAFPCSPAAVQASSPGRPERSLFVNGGAACRCATAAKVFRPDGGAPPRRP